MGANYSKTGADEEVFKQETPISFSPDVVNQLSDHLENSQSRLDSGIQAHIKHELERLKEDEENVRQQIEHALEKENLDREKSMASDGDGTSGSILLGDMDEIRTRIEKYVSRRNNDKVEAESNAVVECYRNNKTTPLECWNEVRNFKERVEQKTIQSLQ